jgi:hypothetical protein
MHALAIIAWCVHAAVIYGIIHDQITARICVEYFTIGHPLILPHASTTELALAWGVLATWWAGLVIGVLLALAARVGRRPKWPVRRIIRPTVGLLIVMAWCAVLAGLIGRALATGGTVLLLEPLASRIPADRHIAFLSAAFAHSASYLVGFIGGLVLALWIWMRRGRGQAALGAR